MKKQLIKECLIVLKRSHVEQWYQENLEGKDQKETINSLMIGVNSQSITEYEALCIAFIVGFQWTEKFRGVK